MHKDLCRCISGIIRYIRVIQMDYDDGSNEAVRIEVDVEGWDTQWLEGLTAASERPGTW